MRKSYIELIIIVLAIVLSVFLVWYYSGFPGSDRQLSLIPDAEADTTPPVIQYIYGLPVDSFSIGGGKVRSNKMLAGLLNDLGVSGADINDAIEKTQQVFDVRKFKAGNKYITFNSFDSIPKLEYFVYEKDAVNYLVIRFKDSIEAWNGIKKIDTIQNTFAGSIQSSLWNTFADVGSNPMMANELSEIYAWTIDFFGLQLGDSLRVVYDEYYVDSASIGIGKIHGAWFRHMNRDFWAIPFLQDNVESFFDDKGNSLRKAFRKAPLRFSRISSRFSNSRMHPILKIRRPHHGVDYSAPVGTPVYSIGDGVIIQTDHSGGSGNMVKIRHNSVYSTAYLHLSKYASGIRKGVFVKQGDIIGYVGSTGLSTGPHLDFRFFKNGFSVDPLKVEAPSVEPVKKENLEAFSFQKILVMKEVCGF
jgi:murein DD-endopeptidase MepM/ murein hydrolase activator NlpD